MLALVLMAGIMAGKYLPLPLWSWLIAALSGIVLFFLRRHSAVVYALVFCLGAAWLQQRYLLPPDSIAFLSAKDRRDFKAAEGMVASDIGRQSWLQGEKTVFELKVNQVLIGDSWRPSSGKTQVNLYGGHPPLHYGQVLRVRGKLHAVFDGFAKGFSYRRYLQEQGIYWLLSVGKEGGCEVIRDGKGNILVYWSMQLRRGMIEVFGHYLAPREAGFTAALVLGDRSGMPKDLKEIFVNTGTAHVLAISGMNMAIVAALFFFALRALGLPRRWQFAGTVIFLFAYAFLTGWSASVVRACFMSSVVLAAFAFEHESDALNSLGLAALVLLALDPKDLFDVGFQLSFAAVAAILALHAHCRKLFAFLPSFLGASMAVSLAAWAGTAPFIFYHFHMLTPVSILANIPIVPLADMVMLLGLWLAAVGGWCPYIGIALAGCLKAILSAMVILAGWFNQIPLGHFIFS